LKLNKYFNRTLPYTKMGCCSSSERVPGGPINSEVLNASKSKVAISEFKVPGGDGKVSFKYVIIGAGNAAGHAAQAFVESGRLAPEDLCIIGTESVLPYERPALTKGFMMGKADLPKFNTCRHQQDWYDTNGILTLLSTTVEKVDLKNKVIKIEDCEIEYKKCLACTGASPIFLNDKDEKGERLKGVYYIRSYEDGKALQARLEEGKSEEKVVLVGGGYIGTEMAGCMTAYNFWHVTMVVSGKHVIKRIFPPRFAKIYEDAIAKNGTSLLKGNRVTGFEGKSGQVSAVLLDDGKKLEADIVVVGVGSRPNTDLFKDQVEMEMRGIKVDGQMKSSIDGFYACGDIATFPIKYLGEMRRLEHVVCARRTAKQAARAMLEIEQDDIDLVPYFYSNIFDLGWMMYGSKSEKEVFFGFSQDNEVEKIFGCLWIDDGSKIMGVLVKGASKSEGKVLENHVRQQAVVSANLLEEGASDELKAYLLGKS